MRTARAVRRRVIASGGAAGAVLGAVMRIHHVLTSPIGSLASAGALPAVGGRVVATSACVELIE